jgi:hypothetical protein
LGADRAPQTSHEGGTVKGGIVNGAIRGLSAQLDANTTIGHCQVEAFLVRIRGRADCRHAALVALRHCAAASDRKIRSVDRETRWALDDTATVKSYKSLSLVERAFCCIKTAASSSSALPRHRARNQVRS